MCYYTNMESNDAIEAFLALGQETRLGAFRLLMEQGPAGLPVSEIAKRLGANLSTVSRHLAQMARADLLRSWREERQVFYAVDHQGTRSLIRFLMDDCCKAHPDICGEFRRRRNACREIRSV